MRCSGTVARGWRGAGSGRVARAGATRDSERVGWMSERIENSVDTVLSRYYHGPTTVLLLSRLCLTSFPRY